MWKMLFKVFLRENETNSTYLHADCPEAFHNQRHDDTAWLMLILLLLVLSLLLLPHYHYHYQTTITKNKQKKPQNKQIIS